MTRSQPGEQVLIIDAGGGTIDISTYTILDNRPLQVEELYEPECESVNHNAGFSIHWLPFQAWFKVGSSSQRGQGRWLKVRSNILLTGRLFNLRLEKWKDSKFDNDGDLSAFSQKFDEGVKRVFSNDQTPQHVKFGSMRDNDLEYGIKAGRFTLTGSTLTHPVDEISSKLVRTALKLRGFSNPLSNPSWTA